MVPSGTPVARSSKSVASFPLSRAANAPRVTYFSQSRAQSLGCADKASVTDDQKPDTSAVAQAKSSVIEAIAGFQEHVEREKNFRVLYETFFPALQRFFRRRQLGILFGAGFGILNRADHAFQVRAVGVGLVLLADDALGIRARGLQTFDFAETLGAGIWRKCTQRVDLRRSRCLGHCVGALIRKIAFEFDVLSSLRIILPLES